MSVGTEGSGPNPRTYSRAEYAALEAECERLKEALREIEWSNDSTWQSDRAKEALSAKP